MPEPIAAHTPNAPIGWHVYTTTLRNRGVGSLPSSQAFEYLVRLPPVTETDLNGGTNSPDRGDEMQTFRENAENCLRLAEGKSDDPSFKRFQRMAAGWHALADEKDWLDGELPSSAACSLF